MEYVIKNLHEVQELYVDERIGPERRSDQSFSMAVEVVAQVVGMVSMALGWCSEAQGSRPLLGP